MLWSLCRTLCSYDCCISFDRPGSRHQSIHHILLFEDYSSARRLIWSPADTMDVRQCHPDVFCHVLSSSNAPMSYIHFFPSSTFFSLLQMFRFSHNLARLASGQCFFSNFLTTCILLSRLLVSLPLSDLASELRLAVDYLKQKFPGSDLWKCLIQRSRHKARH